MDFIRRNWFLIALLAMLVVGYQGAPSLAGLAQHRWFNWLVVATTMFLMAWPIRFEHLKSTMARPVAPLLASVLNVVGIPLLAWPVAVWIGGELGLGVMVAACTPCTLASAAVWTRKAGGDDSVAMLVTIITNATCFIVMPFWLKLQTGHLLESSQMINTVYNLLLFVVLPISLAQLARINVRSAEWATQHKNGLSVWALIGILIMILIGSINMGLRMTTGSADQTTTGDLVWVAVWMGLIHVTMFWTGLGIAYRMGLPRAQAIAVGFSSSQKTLMIGLSVSISLGASIIPIMAYHAVQLIVDTTFANRLKK